MKNYFYIEKIPLIKIIIGNLLFIPSLLALIFINISNGPIPFLFYLFLAYIGVFFISTEGLEFDFQSKKFRKLFSIYGINFGLSWTYFSTIKYIALVETVVKQTFGGRGFRATATTTVSQKTVKINLFNQNDKHQTIYFTNDRIEALKIASEIKNAYQIEVLTNF